jgi:dihydroorotate dehydrogenase
MSGPIYRQIRKLLFTQDSEAIHHSALKLAALAEFPLFRKTLELIFLVQDKRLERQCAGLTFANPIGLAAGFDKNAQAIDFFSALGFGHLELGTVTAQPQPGNPKPRIFRLPQDQALINRMGFPSEGAQVVSQRLAARPRVKGDPIIGINIGKTKAVAIDDAASDYCASFSLLAPYADYVTLNVSSPNTPELRKLQEPERLRALFGAIRSINLRGLPLFVKIAPDLSDLELDEVLDVALSSQASGIIATNTTFSRDCLQTATTEVGGLSGAPLTLKSRTIVAKLVSRLNGALPVIGVGGIMSADDAQRMLDAGAKLIQVYTGLVYAGPAFISTINKVLRASAPSRS